MDEAVTTMMAAFILQAKSTFPSRHSQKSLPISADQFEEYLVTEIFCVANCTAKYCCLSDYRYHVQQLFDKLNEVQFTHQSVDFFYTVVQLRLNKRVYIEGTIFVIMERAVNLTNTSKELHECQMLLKRYD